MLEQQIRKARERLGETQAKFARRFGVHQSTVTRWEKRGVHSPSMAMAIRRVLEELKETAK